jgi:hypothetical protein
MTNIENFLYLHYCALFHHFFFTLEIAVSKICDKVLSNVDCTLKINICWLHVHLFSVSYIYHVENYLHSGTVSFK